MSRRDFDYVEIRRLYAAGVHVKDIVKLTGASRPTVWRAITHDKIATGGTAKIVCREKLAELWQQGLTLIDIGIALGCSSSTITRLVTQHKLPARDVHTNDEPPAPSPEDEAASQSGLALSPWVEARAKECRERHYEKRRSESEETVRTKVWKWSVSS